jgi:hypothetical protein
MQADRERRRAELLAQIDDPAIRKVLAEFSDSVKSAPLSASALTQKDPPPLPETSDAICAAIAHTFTMSAITTSEQSNSTDFIPERVVIQTSNNDERSVILANSTPITFAGHRRLQLSDEARGDLLTRTRENKVFLRLLSLATKVDVDEFDQVGDDDVRLPGAWLRSFLVGKAGDILKAPPREVRAATDALNRLRFAGPGVVKTKFSLTDAQRALELSQLLEPLRILVGMQGGWNGERLRDRFVGREEELARLRAFVDELDSASAIEAVTRGVDRLVKGVRRYFTGTGESVFFLIDTACKVRTRPCLESIPTISLCLLRFRSSDTPYARPTPATVRSRTPGSLAVP